MNMSLFFSNHVTEKKMYAFINLLKIKEAKVYQCRDVVVKKVIILELIIVIGGC